MDKDKKILERKDLFDYAIKRLLPNRSKMSDLLKIKEVRLYCGYSPSLFKEVISGKLIKQTGSIEPIKIDKSVLKVPIYYGMDRQLRYEDLINNLNQGLRKKYGDKKYQIKLTIVFLHDESETRKMYEKFFRDWINNLFMAELKDSFTPLDISSVIIAPFSELIDAAKKRKYKIQVFKDEYINYAFLQIPVKKKKKLVLAIDTMYGSQIGDILKEFAERFHMERRCRKCKIGDLKCKLCTFDFYLHSKAGGLIDGVSRGDLVIPAWTSSEIYLKREKKQKAQFKEERYMINNKLLSHSKKGKRNIRDIKVYYGYGHLVSRSVSGQLKYVLAQAKKLGCASVDMETGSAMHSVKGINEFYRRIRVSFNPILSISDRPLLGDTLAIENKMSKKFKKGSTIAINIIFDMISE